MINSNEKEYQNSINEWILFIYVLGYLILTILPMVKYSVPYIVSGTYCLSFLVFGLLNIYQRERHIRDILIILFCGIVQGVVAYLNDNATLSEIINEPIRALRIIVPCFILYYVLKTSKKIKLFLWIFLTALFLYISVTTLISLLENPWIVRELAGAGEEEKMMSYRMQNVGGFEFSYAFGLMLPLFITLAFKSKYKLIKILGVLLAVFIIYYILSAQYMILFIISIISVFIIVLRGSNEPHIKAIAIFISIASLILIAPIFRWIASLNVGDIMRSRLLNLADFFNGNREIGETSSRVDLYKDALREFLHHPIAGQYSSNASGESHSLVLGTLARTGIIGLSFLIAEFFIYYQTNKDFLQEHDVNTELFNIIFICYVILTVLNPIGYAYEIAIVIFLYVPLTTVLFMDHDRENMALVEDKYEGEGE